MSREGVEKRKKKTRRNSEEICKCSIWLSLEQHEARNRSQLVILKMIWKDHVRQVMAGLRLHCWLVCVMSRRSPLHTPHSLLHTPPSPLHLLSLPLYTLAHTLRWLVLLHAPLKTRQC